VEIRSPPFLFCYFCDIIKAMFKKYFLQILVVLLMLAIAWVLLSLREAPSSTIERASEGKKTEASIYQLAGDKNTNSISSEFFPIRNWLIDEPEISAKSAIIVNFKSGSEKGNILYQKNPNQVLPIASLTKIMTFFI
jgi:D-alanyl-D-alanine carboxypeptidase